MHNILKSQCEDNQGGYSNIVNCDGRSSECRLVDTMYMYMYVTAFDNHTASKRT